MLTAKEIRDKAERSYKDFLLSVLKKEIFFPFHIKGNKGSAQLPLQELYPALKHLIDHSKEKVGYGYALTYKEVNTRHSGIITLPDAIFFDNPTDFLKFIDKEQAFTAFKKALDATRKHAPALLKWIENNPLKCQKYADEWSDILTLVQYFSQNPKPQLFWRQLPLSIDLPFLEIHQPLIAELLAENGALNAPNLAENDPAARLGLRTDEALLRIRVMDKTHFLTPFGDDLSLPISAWADSDWVEKADKIFFITDKNVFLRFRNDAPENQLSLIIFWEHSAAILPKIKWIQTKKCYFLSDISPKGFEILAEMRAFLNFENTPDTQFLTALLMDKPTFEAFPQHHQTQKTTTATPTTPTLFLTHLTPEEQSTYQFLSHLKEKNALSLNDVADSFLEKKLGNIE